MHKWTVPAEATMPSSYELSNTEGNLTPVVVTGMTKESPPPPYSDADMDPKGGRNSPDTNVTKKANGSGDGSSRGYVEVTSNSQVVITNGKDDEGKKKDTETKMVGITETFRFSTSTDRLLMFVGFLSACIHGAALPCMIIIFGNMTDSFITTGSLDNFLEQYVPVWLEACTNMSLTFCGDITEEYYQQDPDPPSRIVDTCQKLMNPPGCEVINSTAAEDQLNDLLEEVRGYTIYYAIIGAGVLVVGYFQVLCWQIAAYNQAQRIRTKLLWAILRQEIGWFDTHEIGELNSRLADDVMKIEGGIGDKLGMFFQWISAFVAGIIIGFVFNWKLTLVILAVSPLLAMCGMAMGKLGSSMTSKELQAYAKAGAVAEEVIGAIRTVVAFGGEQKESSRYNKNLDEARAFGIKKGMLNGISMGLIFLVMFGSYALAFWYGSKLVFNEEITAGTLMIVFFCVLIGTFSLGNATPNIQDFATARGAAFAIYGIINNIPLIDSSSDKNRRFDENVSGNIEFKNVHFSYPSRSEITVLRGLSLKINVGQTVALVGASGCGKSTTVQLIQRFYDPAIGEVTLDGTDIRQFNVKWLRQQIGVVSQEPVLFATTIAENIRYGHENVTMDDIVKACKESNAHDFITKLPNQYETLVGERGAQLSGGQKQRIAIARALVRNPKVLLLDEATSALDTESEASVQAALDVARQGRTTLVIAHRLSTIRTADVIMGIKDGQVVEQGTHDQLMAQNGLYYELCTNQQMNNEDIEDDEPMKIPIERALSATDNSKSKRLISTTSHGKDEETDTKEEKDDEKLPDPELKRIMRLNAPEVGLIIIGCICAIIVGGVQPAFAIIFSDIIGLYAEPGPDVQDTVNLYAGMFAVIGVVAALGMIGMGACFSRSGEFLTWRLRQLAFQTIMKQEIAYFDDHKNNVGALCTRLATDASAVQGATGSRLGTFCQSIASIGAGLIIGFVYSWQMTLLILAFLPFILAAGFIQMRFLSGNRGDKKTALENAGKIAIEAIENIRTVATLTKEQKFLDDYEKETLRPYTDNKKKAHIQAIAFSFSQAVIFFAYAAAFYLGAYLVEQRKLEFQNMFRVFSAIVFGAISAGQASSFAPDYGKAKESAAKMFALFDRVPAIDSSSKDGKKLAQCSGEIALRGVQFNYPTRPKVAVLTGLDLTVTSGQTVALVGSSGCGKSTTVQLMERFYDPLDGTVMVEGEDIRELNLMWLRSQMGIVSQEPILFDCSIRDNIAYGDNSREVSMAEIIEAAKKANIHNFIDTLTQGYDTNVGDKGAQLSGGQKQRVAIARALIRNPKILLLDEATSALDTESEKVVQAALDRAQEGRTCIVIAHRLSTIQNADCIVVIHHGRVVEMGKHQELLQQRGRYYKLNNAQLKKS